MAPADVADERSRMDDRLSGSDASREALAAHDMDEAVRWLGRERD